MLTLLKTLGLSLTKAIKIINGDSTITSPKRKKSQVIIRGRGLHIAIQDLRGIANRVPEIDLLTKRIVSTASRIEGARERTKEMWQSLIARSIALSIGNKSLLWRQGSSRRKAFQRASPERNLARRGNNR